MDTMDREYREAGLGISPAERHLRGKEEDQRENFNGKALVGIVLYERTKRPVWLEPSEQIGDRAISCRAGHTLVTMLDFYSKNGRKMYILQGCPGLAEIRGKLWGGKDLVTENSPGHREEAGAVQVGVGEAQNSMDAATGFISNFAIFINSVTLSLMSPASVSTYFLFQNAIIKKLQKSGMRADLQNKMIYFKR